MGVHVCVRERCFTVWDWKFNVMNGALYPLVSCMGDSPAVNETRRSGVRHLHDDVA